MRPNINVINLYVEYLNIQIEQRVRIGKIFARWHLAIAITSLTIEFLTI